MDRPRHIERASDAERIAAEGNPQETIRPYFEEPVKFMDLELLVSPGVLVPRPETELLGRTAVRILQEGKVTLPGRSPRIIDMCCGAGNLACAIAHAVPAAQVWACDLTASSVTLAQQNVHKLHVESQVEVCQGDLFASLAPIEGMAGTIDLVVCNPPYISSSKLKKELAHLLEHEPLEAFDGGPYGLTIFQRVLADATKFLRPGGRLMFEFGVGQERLIELLFQRARAYEDLRWFHDAAGQPRVVLATRKKD